jgi:hypothetical protein
VLRRWSGGGPAAADGGPWQRNPDFPVVRRRPVAVRWGPVVVAATNHHNYKIHNKYNIKLLFYIKKKVFNFELIKNLFLILKNLVS